MARHWVTVVELAGDEAGDECNRLHVYPRWATGWGVDNYAQNATLIFDVVQLETKVGHDRKDESRDTINDRVQLGASTCY
jgi:hypothetical protein